MRYRLAKSAVTSFAILTAVVTAVVAAPTDANAHPAPPTITAPACTDAVAAAPTLPRPVPSYTTVSGAPFGVTTTQDGRHGFVALSPSLAGGPDLDVLTVNRTSATVQRTVTLPGDGDGAGVALSPDDRYLAVTLTSATSLTGYTDILSVPALISGRGNPVLATLDDGAVGQIEAAFSADARYVFVSDEYSFTVSVFDLSAALAPDSTTPAVNVGQIPVPPVPVGLVLSPDGQRLYLTSEASRTSGGIDAAVGQLSVLDVRTAEHDPANALITSVDAGCQPVRVALADNGRLAWVSARGSDALLAFDTSAIQRDPAHALLADVPVGSAPVGVLPVDDGKLVLVANSNRFATGPLTPQNVSVVDAGAALAGEPAQVGLIPAGAFPREFGYDRARNLVLLTNFLSLNVETFPAPR